MINEKELSINNQSYTKKDFASIYPELVDVIRSLTNRWDPKTSNESDPGVVLTKECAFIGDKLNYNIDKNILETFMPSCTQETSMRQNCESRAYEMEYYNAAETEVTFSYNGEKLNDNEVVTFKAFKTSVKSQDDSVFYVLTKDVELKSDNLVRSVLAIEGEYSQLTVASSTNEYLIQLVNLDDNNRIYFPVSNVAQNGIFITNSKGDWKRVLNLNVEQPGQPVYKFGYSSQKGLPYVEFPSDISKLINEGLSISYITTNGTNGNVPVGYLNGLGTYVATKGVPGSEVEYRPNLEDSEQEIYIRNESASTNGRNPQTVEEAYESYKKTIGVFDTYVTCRDYESAIYNMLDSDKVYTLVSNVNVADRRDDINYGVRYLTFEDDASLYLNYASSDITAYDLCLYPLQPMKATTLTDYNNSFIPLLNTSEIRSNLENSKCASHDYKTSYDNKDIWAIKNIATLDAKIVTTYKVNNYERAQIIQNIQQALITNFNSRQVDYGYEIPYDIILNVIKNADERISFVSLAEPELKTTYINKDSKINSRRIYQESKIGAEDYFSVVVARNVLSGGVSLLDFDSRFNFDFGQDSSSCLSNLSKITSHANITIEKDESNNGSYTLNDNEVIQIVGPSLITDVSYTAYTYYWLEANHDIEANKNYKLAIGEVLHMGYVNSEDKWITKSYPSGTIIKSNITLKYISSNPPATILPGMVQKGDKYYYQLGAKDSIDIRRLNKVTLDSTTNCYWLRNNKTNALFKESDLVPGSNPAKYRTILEDDEYFFYTDNGFNVLYTLGSGTTLETTIAPIDANESDTWKITRVDLESILENGLLQLKGNWKTLYFTNTNYLELQENTIITLVKNNEINLEGMSNDLALNNTLQPLNCDSCTYTIDGEEDSLEKYDVGDMSWEIRSRLDIIASKDKAQTLLENQEITFYDKNATTFDDTTSSHSIHIEEGASFNLNLSTDLAGGNLVDVSSLNADNKTIYPLIVYSYTLDASIQPERVKSKYWTLKFEGSTPSSKTISVPTISIYKENYRNGEIIEDEGETIDESSIVMIYLPQDDVTFTFTSTGGNLYEYGEFDDNNDPIAFPNINAKGIYTMQIEDSVTSITISATGEGNIVLDLPKFYSGYNPQLGVKSLCKRLADIGEIEPEDIEEEEEEVYKKIENYIKNHSDNKFYYSATLNNVDMIEVDDLSSPYALYDYNNYANKCTITQLDIENSSIDVVRSSRL